MSESFDEQVSRVRLMASGEPTWDLSDNDRAALQAVLDALATTTPSPSCETCGGEGEVDNWVGAYPCPACTSPACETCGGRSLVPRWDGIGGDYRDIPCPDCTPAADEDEERRRFEAWEVREKKSTRARLERLDNTGDLRHSDPRPYAALVVRERWDAWLAAKADAGKEKRR